MTRIGLLLLPLLLLGAAPPATPRHIMSINLCTDLPLLMLVPKQRIASITYLAHEAADALMPGSDAGVAVNHALAEEILRQKPDLILASQWSTPVVRRLAKQVGAPIFEVETATDFADIRRLMRRLGTVVGEPARAEALVRGMDAELARLAATQPARRVRVVAWSGDTVPGRGTLVDAIITAAGAVNVAAKFDDNRYSSFDLEELLQVQPDAILQGVARYDAPSLRRAVSRHPLIDRLFRGRQIDYPEGAYTCGLPQSAHAAAELRGALAQVAPRTRW